MKISTKGRYGLRAMLDLAVNSVGEHVALNCIAERQDISDNYLEQVFSILRKAGLVKSIKGAQGGYVLTDKPSNITVGKILRALEGNLSVIDGDTGMDNMQQGSVKHCINTYVWEKINESISEVVDFLTLEDLVNDYKRINGNSSLMFYI